MIPAAREVLKMGFDQRIGAARISLCAPPRAYKGCHPLALSNISVDLGKDTEPTKDTSATNEDV